MQELREMDGQMNMARAKNTLARRNTVMSLGDNQNQLRSELHTLQRKFERLEKKEKRIQVDNI